MVKPIRISATLTAIGLVSALAACSTPGAKQAMTGNTLFGKVDSANIGLATKAQMALAVNDIATATSLAERAVEHSPTDAGFRALLGNCYLAAGRFGSAEQAFSDSLSLVQNQPQIVLKLALTQIALGRGDNAAKLIASAASMIDASDAGLALALAGHPNEAIAVLEPAARDTGADARVRQNLALAYAFAGNWDSARVIAGQDVPGDQIDARMKDWMKLASPAQPMTKIAGFLGITPAASDAGQPTRLALVKLAPTIEQADAAPMAMPAPIEAAAPAPVAAPVAIAAPVEAASVAAPVEIAAAAPIAVPAPIAAPVAIPAAREFPLAPPAPVQPPRHALLHVARPALTPTAVRLTQSVRELHRAALSMSGSSRAVVQLGAYSTRARVTAAWSHAAIKFGALRNFQPVTARFDGPKGTVYRLAVHGFGNGREALSLCNSLKRSGGNCFVRAISGDAPIQFASR